MFKKHNGKIKKVLSETTESNVIRDYLSLHRRMILRIQHERLIHLLVTIFVGVVMTLVFLVTVFTKNVHLFYLTLPLILLFLAYIFHYRYLENTTQGWYEIEDALEKKLNAAT